MSLSAFSLQTNGEFLEVFRKFQGFIVLKLKMEAWVVNNLLLLGDQHAHMVANSIAFHLYLKSY